MTTTTSAQQELDGFLDKYPPEIAARARAALARLRQLAPGAQELVYDNYHALAIGFGPTRRAADVIFSIALYPRRVSLFFLQPRGLPDPSGRLQGTGKAARHVVLEDASDMDQPAVRTLIGEALARARVPLDPARRGGLVIKPAAAHQRPRRPGERGP